MQDLLVTWFGATGATVVRYAIALIVVIGLLMLLRWFLRNYAVGGQLSIGRARQNRLTVVDQVTIDQRRRLLLVRRDNVEHLILIGGGNDLVVEPTIIRGVPVGSLGRAAARPAQAAPAGSDEVETPAINETVETPVAPPRPIAPVPAAERSAPRPAFPSHVSAEHPKATSIQARLNRVVPPRKPLETSRPESSSPYIPPEAHRVEPTVAPIAAIVQDKAEPAVEAPRSERRVLPEPPRAVPPPQELPPLDGPGFDDLARQLDEALKSEIEGMAPELPAAAPEPVAPQPVVEAPPVVEPPKPVVPAASAWLRPRAAQAPRAATPREPAAREPAAAPTPRAPLAPRAAAVPPPVEVAPAAPEPVVTPRVADVVPEPQPEADAKGGADFSSLENEMARLLDELAGDSKGKR